MTSKKKMIFSMIIMIGIGILAILLFMNHKEDVNDKEKEPEYVEDIETPRIDVSNLENAKIKDGEKVNTSSKLAEKHYAIYDFDETLSKLAITDATVVSDREKDVSYFRATLTNTGNISISSGMLTIIFFDENGNYFYSIDYGLLEEIKPGKSVNIETYDLDDFINCYDYQVRILG